MLCSNMHSKIIHEGPYFSLSGGGYIYCRRGERVVMRGSGIKGVDSVKGEGWVCVEYGVEG